MRLWNFFRNAVLRNESPPAAISIRRAPFDGFIRGIKEGFLDILPLLAIGIFISIFRIPRTMALWPPVFLYGIALCWLVIKLVHGIANGLQGECPQCSEQIVTFIGGAYRFRKQTPDRAEDRCPFCGEVFTVPEIHSTLQS